MYDKAIELDAYDVISYFNKADLYFNISKIRSCSWKVKLFSSRTNII